MRSDLLYLVKHIVAMDLQSRKLNLISYLTQIQDETILNEIENYLNKLTKGAPETFPFTPEAFMDRIQESEQDIKEGKFKTQSDLEKISEDW